MNRGFVRIRKRRPNSVPTKRMGSTSKSRPALETIEAFVDASLGWGPIVRVGGAAEDPSKPWCPVCGRREAKPMPPADAKDARRAVRRAGLDDAVAFAFSKTTILVTHSNQFRICPCDLRAWQRAIELYRCGPRAAWRSIGVVAPPRLSRAP
jgi:hypothetical protein